MARDGQFTCRFPAHALGITERLGDAARRHGLVTWTTSLTDGRWEIRFEGPVEPLRQFAATLGIRQPETIIEEQ